MKHVFDTLAQQFVRENVDTCFALLGDANMNFATRLAELGCRMVYVRHEHCAAASAMAYARKTGRVGVATVTCGPGLTQLTTALPAAVRAHLPVVVFAGEAPLKSAWYNQAVDQAPIVEATGAAYNSLHVVERMPIAIRDAFLQAQLERRPVVLGVPFDLQAMPWPGDVELAAPSETLIADIPPVMPNSDAIEQARGLVDGAERIVVMAGLGAVEAGAAEACKSLASRIDGLLATTLPARGLFCDDPYSIGIAGGFSTDTARACFEQADLVIAVGCSLSHHNADGGKLWPDAKLLQVDTAPVTISQGRIAANYHVLADARLGVEALTEKVRPKSNAWRTPNLAQQISEAPADGATFPQDPDGHDPREVVAQLEAALPLDWETVNSSGHCSYFFAQMPSRPQSRFLTIREFGAIGNGIAFAMGVAAARPDDTVVLFDGDGSLLMHVQELETIKRHRLKILIVVMNDGAYGSEIHKLRAEGLDDKGALFGRTDIGAIARGFGLIGETVTSLEAIPSLLSEFANQDGAAVWDIPVSDKVCSPVIRRSHA